MGVSTDGILAYGWNLGDGSDEVEWAFEFIEELSEKYDGDVDELILAKLDYQGDPVDYKAQIDFKNALPFEIITHCSCDYPMYILTLKETNWSASRGYVQDLTEKLDVLSNHNFLDGMLYDAASKLGLNPPEGPRLLLASLWC